MSATASTSTSLKEYLKKYTSTADEEKKKKRKKKRTKPETAKVLVVDEDPIWQKPVTLEEEEDSADEEKPQVDEDIEVKRMRRLEQLRSKRPYGAISEDGSGWVSVSEIPKIVKSEDPDISPPRSRRHPNDTKPSRSEEHSDIVVDADLSPPRQRNKQYRSPSPSDVKISGGRKARYDTPSPDTHRQSNMPADADLSPPRRHKQYLGSPSGLKFSDGRKARYDTPSPDSHLEDSQFGRMVTDLSPHRQRKKHEPSPEPERKSSHSKYMDYDISPPRRPHHGTKHRNDLRTPSTSDLSPPRKGRDDGFESVLSGRKSSRNRNEHDADDIAPPVSDLSPPRRQRKGSPVLVDHPKTGLVSGKDMKDEIDRKKRDDLLRYKEMDPSVSGRDAEPIYRNKLTGERMSKEEFMKSHKKEKKEEKPKEIKLEWGKGLAQKREAEKRLEEMENEKNKPFARSRDDPDLDKMLKDRVRWGDPMAHLVKKKQWEPVLPDFGDDEKMKESGFIIPQEIPSHSWIRRGLDAAPNRYGIKPGRHWDGVDRSNGYEKEMFKRKNEKSATEREAYLWSVSDM